MVNYDSEGPSRNSRLGISVESSPEMKSTLTISGSGSSDAGNYTCKPSNALPASVQVFVSEGPINKTEFLKIKLINLFLSNNKTKINTTKLL